MAILYEKPKQWQSYHRVIPVGFSVITGKQATPEILKKAREFINRKVKGNAAFGESEEYRINGRKIRFVVEPHYHEPNGPVKPWGWHKGATVFIGPEIGPIPWYVYKVIWKPA